MATHSSASRLRAPTPRPEPAITPFWNRLNAFFLFPFQSRPLLYAAFLSLCSLTLMVTPVIGLIVLVFVLLATARYSFKVAAMASMGVLDSADYGQTESDPAWTYLPWKFLGVLFVHGLLMSLLTAAGTGPALLGRLASSLLMPATLMVLIQTCSMGRALNPGELMRAVTGVGLPYLLLCLFMVLLSVGMPLAWALLLPIAPKGLIAPVMVFVGVYFSWVTASMVGYVMFQNHKELEIDLVQQPAVALKGAARRVESPEQQLARERDAEVAALVRQGQIKEACDLAYDWQRVDPDSLAEQRRYHRVLLLTDKTDTLAWFTQKHIGALLKENKGQDALQVHAATLVKLPDLVLESAVQSLALARLAWKGLNGAQALALLKGFDKRYPRHATVPMAYELIGRVLHQGMGRTAQAVAVYHGLKKLHPDHASTQELAWLLRGHTGEAK